MSIVALCPKASPFFAHCGWQAIEFNSIPSINKIVPGGYEYVKFHIPNLVEGTAYFFSPLTRLSVLCGSNMKLRVQIAIPASPEEVDQKAIRDVFPYGQMLPIEVRGSNHVDFLKYSHPVLLVCCFTMRTDAESGTMWMCESSSSVGGC